MPEHPNSFQARDTLKVGDREHTIFRLDALQSKYDVARLPFSLKVLLENLLRTEGNGSVQAADIEKLARWDAKAEPSEEIAFTPARVVMQDFTGVPAVVDLAAMRDAMADLGGDASRINPLVPAELVIDHSVQVDVFGTRDAFTRQRRARVRAQRGALRVPALGPGRLRQLLRRAARHRHRAPGQPRVPRARRLRRRQTATAYPDTLVGTDSHTTMINGLGRAGLGRRRHRGRGGDARPADVDAHPAGPRLQAPRRAARGRHRDRPRPHGHRAPAQEGRRGQVRRVLRPRRLAPAAGRPRDDRQHEPRVRLDLRDLPGRSRDAALPGLLRAPEGAHRARRGLRQGAGPLARRGRRGADLLRHRRTRPRRRRALVGGPQAPAGPRAAARREGRLPRGTGRPRRSGRRGADRPRPRRGHRRDLPRLRSARQRRARPRARPARARRRARGGRRDRDRRALRDRGRRHARRGDLQARPRARRHRRHHVVHQHLQPVGHARRRAAGPQRRGPRADAPAVGQDVAGARVQGGDRVPRPRRADRAARGARLQPRRLRLHDVHRQLRPAARRDQRRGRRARPRGRARCSAATATSRGASTPT